MTNILIFLFDEVRQSKYCVNIFREQLCIPTFAD